MGSEVPKYLRMKIEKYGDISVIGGWPNIIVMEDELSGSEFSAFVSRDGNVLTIKTSNGHASYELLKKYDENRSLFCKITIPSISIN